MRKAMLAALGLWLGVALQSGAQEDESRALVEKAIKAHGGADKLSRANAKLLKAKGKVNIMNMDLPVTFEVHIQLPDRTKLAGELEINNMTIAVTQVYDGKKGWQSFLGKTQEMDKKTLEELKNNLYVEKLTNLVELRDRAYKLSPLGEGKVEGRDAVGIQVTKKGARDVNLWFDKQTHTLVKLEHRAFDNNTMQDVNQEKIFTEYKDVNGLKVPGRVLVKHDGNRFADFEVTETTFVDRHDDSIFAKP
jgi:hypothetical protein